MDIGTIRCGYMDWINLVQFRDQWRALLNTEIKFWEIA
jgi:hypothetical protein